MNSAELAELVACLRLWTRGATLDSEKLRMRSLAAIEAVEYDPNRGRATVPCVESNGMPCECRDLLCEVLPYVRHPQLFNLLPNPNLVERIESLLRRDVRVTA